MALFGTVGKKIGRAILSFLGLVAREAVANPEAKVIDMIRNAARQALADAILEKPKARGASLESAAVAIAMRRMDGLPGVDRHAVAAAVSALRREGSDG